MIIPIKIVTAGNHAYVGYKAGQSGGCVHGEYFTTDLEDRGHSNHGSSHTFNFTQNVSSGDWYRYSIWQYVYANNKSIKLYVNGRLRGTSSGTVQCATITYQFTPADFIVGGQAGTPTYLETLDKLDQWSSAHYVPSPKGLGRHKGGNKLNL